MNMNSWLPALNKNPKKAKVDCFITAVKQIDK